VSDLSAPSSLRPARQTLFWASLALGVLALLLLPVLLTSFHLFFATLVLCYVIVAVGLNVVLGYSGQISITQAGLMGIGAYATTLLILRAGLPMAAALAVGAIFTTLIGCVVAIPALRIRGHYLALATLAFQLIVQTIIANWIDVTRGPNGLPVPSVDLFGLALDDRGTYWLVAAIALAMVVFARNVARSRFGRALIAIRDDELVAQVMGVDLTRYKTQAFGVSAFYAGLGGGLFAITVGFLDPAAFTLWESVRHLVMVILGGMGTILGPVVGAILVGGAPEFLQGFEERWPIIYYVTLIVILMFLPAGVVGGLQRAFGRVLPADLVRTRHEVGVRRVAAEPDERPAPAAATPGRDEELVAEEGEPILVVRNVSLRFGGLQALTDVSLDVREGEIAGLIGPNGAGKTTLFNVMTRVIRPDEGDILLGGHRLLEHRTHEIVGLGLSRTFQNVELCGSMSVAENVILGSHHRLGSGLLKAGLRAPGMIAEERRVSLFARGLLEQLGLAHHAETRVSELPLGLQRRIELARALAAEPKVVLLDEPASGLSQQEAAELMADIRRLRDRGITVLVIEHNVAFVMGLCSRVTVIDKGEVIYQGSAAGAQRDDRVVEAYLGRQEYSYAED
jgi:branched-chain amino acid transport system ATP-binding protein/branched-chain amino acid transport system permease protein